MTLMTIPYQKNGVLSMPKDVSEHNKLIGRHEFEPQKCNNIVSYPDQLGQGQQSNDHGNYYVQISGTNLEEERIDCTTNADVQRFLVHCALKGASFAVDHADWNTRYWLWADVCSMVAIGSEDTVFSISDRVYYSGENIGSIHDDSFSINADMRNFKYGFEQGNFSMISVQSSMSKAFVDLAVSMSNYQHSTHGQMTPKMANNIMTINFHLYRTMYTIPDANMAE